MPIAKLGASIHTPISPAKLAAHQNLRSFGDADAGNMGYLHNNRRLYGLQAKNEQTFTGGLTALLTETVLRKRFTTSEPDHRLLDSLRSGDYCLLNPVVETEYFCPVRRSCRFADQRLWSIEAAGVF